MYWKLILIFVLFHKICFGSWNTFEHSDNASICKDSELINLNNGKKLICWSECNGLVTTLKVSLWDLTSWNTYELTNLTKNIDEIKIVYDEQENYIIS